MNLNPLPLTVLSGIIAIKEKLSFKELPKPVIEDLMHIRKVMTADTTYTYNYDLEDVISFSNNNLFFNEYGDCAIYKDVNNNVYHFDYIDDGVEHLLHSFNVNSDSPLNETEIKETMHQLGFPIEKIPRPSLEIVLFVKFGGEGGIIYIQANRDSDENTKILENVKKILMTRNYKEYLEEAYKDANRVSFTFGNIDDIFYCYIQTIRCKYWLE